MRAWAYAYLLPERRSTSKAWIDGAPRRECVVVPVLYGLLAMIVKRSLKLEANTVVKQRAIMDVTLGLVGDRLGDGRRYLVGDRLSAADLALATLLAPAVLTPASKLRASDLLPEALGARHIIGRNGPPGRGRDSQLPAVQRNACVARAQRKVAPSVYVLSVRHRQPLNRAVVLPLPT